MTTEASTATQVAEETIEQQLEKFRPYETTIAEMKERAMSLKIEDINDKDGYKNVYAARQLVKNKRLEVDKMRKALNEDALKRQKMVNGEAQRIIGQLEPIEDHLQQEEDKYNAWKIEEKRKKEREEEERISRRNEVLINLQMAFDGRGYGMGKLYISNAEVTDMAEDIFQTFVDKVKPEADRIAAEKAEQERLRKEEEEKIQKERAELEQLRKQQEEREAEMKRQQEAEQEKLRKEREAMEQERLAADRKQKEEQERLDAEKRKLEQERLDAEKKSKEQRFVNRSSELTNLGMVANGSSFSCTEVREEGGTIGLTLASGHVMEATDTDWPGIIAEAKAAVAAVEKLRADKKELADIASKREAEEKQAKAKQEEERRAAMLPEKEKMRTFFNSMQLAERPQVNSQEAKTVMANFNQKITFLLGECLEQTEQL